MEASWCAYKRDITVNSVSQHNLSNKALFQNNNISNKALFQITMSQTRRYSKQQCLKQGVIPKQRLKRGVIPKQQCLKQGVIPKQQCLKQGVIPKQQCLKRGVIPKQQCLKQGVIPKQQCLKQGVIPKYAQIKVPYTSLASIITQKKMQISRIWEEIKFLYKKCLSITSNWLYLPLSLYTCQ